MIHFTQHIPSFCDGFEREEFDVKTLEELLKKENHCLKSKEHRLVWAYAKDNVLMVSSTSDNWHWVIGFVTGIDLSKYLPYYDSCYKIPLDAKVKIVKLNPTYYKTANKEKLDELYIVEGTTINSEDAERYSIRSLSNPKNSWAWVENERQVLFVRYATPEEIEYSNKSRSK